MSFIKNILHCLNYNTYWFSIISCLKVAGYILFLIENKEQKKILFDYLIVIQN